LIANVRRVPLHSSRADPEPKVTMDRSPMSPISSDFRRPHRQLWVDCGHLWPRWPGWTCRSPRPVAPDRTQCRRTVSQICKTSRTIAWAS